MASLQYSTDHENRLFSLLKRPLAPGENASVDTGAVRMRDLFEWRLHRVVKGEYPIGDDRVSLKKITMDDLKKLRFRPKGPSVYDQLMPFLTYENTTFRHWPSKLKKVLGFICD